jgi:hypothetical protein
MKQNAMCRALFPALATLCATAGAQTPPDRTSLPLPEGMRPSYKEIDARDAKMPPRTDVKAPKGAPNVVIVLIDDLGFGATSTFGGPAKGGKGTLLMDGEKVGEGRIGVTQAGLFSADETADVGIDLGTPVVEAIGAEAKSRFTGRIPKLTVEVK